MLTTKLDVFAFPNSAMSAAANGRLAAACIRTQIGCSREPQLCKRKLDQSWSPWMKTAGGLEGVSRLIEPTVTSLEIPHAIMMNGYSWTSLEGTTQNVVYATSISTLR